MQILFPCTTLLAILGEAWLPPELLSSGLAKAFELLWLQFNSAPVAQGPRINMYDRRAIQEALHIMGSNLEAPPLAWGAGPSGGHECIQIQGPFSQGVRGNAI